MINHSKISINDINNGWKIFQQNIEATVNAIPNKDDIAYLGAAQMLPVLNWHENKLCINQIYDDNPLELVLTCQTWLPILFHLMI